MNSSLDHAQPQAGGFVWPAFTVHGSCASYKFNGTGTPSPARLRGVGLYRINNSATRVLAPEGIEAPIGAFRRRQFEAGGGHGGHTRPGIGLGAVGLHRVESMATRTTAAPKGIEAAIGA